MTLRILLLGAKAVADREPSDPLAVHMRAISLRACAAPDVLRTSGPDQLTDRSVRDVLLREPSCPRSVWFCLDSVSRLTGGEPVRRSPRRCCRVIAVPEDDRRGQRRRGLARPLPRGARPVPRAAQRRRHRLHEGGRVA